MRFARAARRWRRQISFMQRRARRVGKSGTPPFGRLQLHRTSRPAEAGVVALHPPRSPRPGPHFSVRSPSAVSIPRATRMRGPDLRVRRTRLRHLPPLGPLQEKTHQRRPSRPSTSARPRPKRASTRGCRLTGRVAVAARGGGLGIPRLLALPLLTWQLRVQHPIRRWAQASVSATHHSPPPPRRTRRTRLLSLSQRQCKSSLLQSLLRVRSVTPTRLLTR